MAIFGVYIINRAGGLIYQYDHNMPRVEVEKTYGFPLDLTLKTYDGKIVVSFGQKDGVKGNVHFRKIEKCDLPGSQFPGC